VQVNFTYSKSDGLCKNSSLSLHWKHLIFLGLLRKPAIQRGEVAISGSHSRQMAKIGLELVFLAPQLSALDYMKKTLKIRKDSGS